MFLNFKKTYGFLSIRRLLGHFLPSPPPPPLYSPRLLELSTHGDFKCFVLPRAVLSPWLPVSTPATFRGSHCLEDKMGTSSLLWSLPNLGVQSNFIALPKWLRDSLSLITRCPLPHAPLNPQLLPPRTPLARLPQGKSPPFFKKGTR